MASDIKIATGRRRLSCKRYLMEEISLGGRAPIGASKGRSLTGYGTFPGMRIALSLGKWN